MKSEQNEWIKCNKLNALQSQEIIALKDRIKRLEWSGGLALGYASKGDFESADKVWREANEDKS